MFDWVGDLIDGIGEAITEAFQYLGTQISNAIWNTMLKWFYETIYNAVADFFTMMGNMGADIFALDWVQATIKLFTLFGWSLFIAGLVVAIFDVAIEYQHGRADIKTASINILKGFFACSLIGIVPVELYKFCISLQNTFSRDLSALFASGQSICGGRAVYVLSAEGLLGRLCAMDEAGGGNLSDRFYADNTSISRSAYLPRQYAAGAWHHAGRQRGTEDCAAVRSR